MARARGVPLGEEVLERTLAWLDAVAWDATVSMHRDLAAGRPSELLDQTGAVARLGAEAGVPVPLHDTLLAALLPLERAARARRRGSSGRDTAGEFDATRRGDDHGNGTPRRSNSRDARFVQRIFRTPQLYATTTFFSDRE